MTFLRKLAVLGFAAVLTGVLSAQAPVERVSPSVSPQAPLPPPPGPLQPPGVARAFSDLTSQPATRSSFTLDRDTLHAILGNQPAEIHAVTVTDYHYGERVFYVPEALAALRAAYSAAGWKHLVEANVSPREEASPEKPITDLWFHFHGAEIDDIAVLVRSPREMDVIDVSGLLRPLDLIHLGGHFGIPKVDPDAVMVPAPPGR